jgi:hypothetical protein
MKKVFGFTSIFLSLSFLFAACGGGGEKTQNPPKPDTPEVLINIAPQTYTTITSAEIPLTVSVENSGVIWPSMDGLTVHSETSATFKAEIPGTYAVTVTARANSAKTATATITVDPPPWEDAFEWIKEIPVSRENHGLGHTQKGVALYYNHESGSTVAFFDDSGTETQRIVLDEYITGNLNIVKSNMIFTNASGMVSVDKETNVRNVSDNCYRNFWTQEGELYALFLVLTNFGVPTNGCGGGSYQSYELHHLDATTLDVLDITPLEFFGEGADTAFITPNVFPLHNGNLMLWGAPSKSGVQQEIIAEYSYEKGLVRPVEIVWSSETGEPYRPEDFDTSDYPFNPWLHPTLMVYSDEGVYGYHYTASSISIISGEGVSEVSLHKEFIDADLIGIGDSFGLLWLDTAEDGTKTIRVGKLRKQW